MIQYVEVALKDLLSEIGEASTNEVLSDFSCKRNGSKESLNNDVELFLKEKSVLFESCGIARTYLLFATDARKKVILIGYYSIAFKSFAFQTSVSIKQRKIIAGHHYFQKGPLPAILIGQLAKNYSDNALGGSLIYGREILSSALSRIKEAYKTIGFTLIYLECKDVPFLRSFYQDHGFELHVNSDGTPCRNDDSDPLLIYIAPVKILDKIISK